MFLTICRRDSFRLVVIIFAYYDTRTPANQLHESDVYVYFENDLADFSIRNTRTNCVRLKHIFNCTHRNEVFGYDPPTETHHSRVVLQIRPNALIVYITTVRFYGSKRAHVSVQRVYIRIHVFRLCFL